MAKDHPGARDKASTEERSYADGQRAEEDVVFEGDREALKRARENQNSTSDSNDGEGEYGNLHFGEQKLDEPKTLASRNAESGEAGPHSDIGTGHVQESYEAQASPFYANPEAALGEFDVERLNFTLAEPDETTNGEAFFVNTLQSNEAQHTVLSVGSALDSGGPLHRDQTDNFVERNLHELEEAADNVATPVDGGIDNPDGENELPEEPSKEVPDQPDPVSNTAPIDITLTGPPVYENVSGASIAYLTAADADIGELITFSIADDASSLFEINGDELRLKEGLAFDYEAQHQYQLTINATDKVGNSFSKVITIDVSDVNEAPHGLSLGNLSIAENAPGEVIGPLSVTDPDAGDSVQYTVSDDRFEVVGGNLKLKDSVALDAEETDSIDVIVTATDQGGLSSAETFTIAVTNVNEAPQDIQLSNLSVSENVAGGVVGALSVTDPDAGDSVRYTVSDDRFEVVDGRLKLKDGIALDAEEAASIEVTITATDQSGLASEESFSINISDANEGPSLSVVTSAGLKASYYNIGHSLSDLGDVDFGAAPDAQGVVERLDYMAGQDSFWEGAPSDFFAAKYEGQLIVSEGGLYTINMASDDGSMLFINGVAVLDNDGLHGTRTRSVSLDLEAGSHEIEVRYFENGGAQTLQLSWAGPDTNGVTEIIGDGSFEHGAAVGNLTLDEDAAGGIVAQLAVTDPDVGDTHTFSIDDDRFEVVEQEGGLFLKLKDDVSIDYETESNVNVAVTVTDSAGASDTLDFPITIANTNSAPEISLVGGEGLRASYYNIGHSLSDLDQVDFNAAPDATGVVQSLNYMAGQDSFWDGAPTDYFAAKYEGQILVSEGGQYTFSMASDDGSMLFIDGVAVLDNDGLHGTRTRTVNLDLEAGSHDIEVRYFENGGAQTLRLAWAGPDTGGVTEVIGGAAYRLPGFEDSDLLGVTENIAGDAAARLSIIDSDGDAINIMVSDDRFEVVEDADGYVLKLKEGAEVDYEAEFEISVTVTATDPSGESASETFAIPVANVNEAPVGLELAAVSRNGALLLNADGGVDDAAIATNLEAFPTDALTVEVRFSSDQTDVGNGTPLFSYAASNGSDNEVLVWLEGASGNLNIFLAGQKINTGVSNASLLDGQEHQLSFTWEQSSDELKVYIDGESAFETSINIRNLKAGGTLVFGQEQDREGGGFAANQVFEGEIAEVRIFDYARSSEEVEGHAGAPIAGPETEPGLINNWQMNAAPGGMIEDFAGSDNLQLQNGAAVELGMSFEAPTVFENVSGAVAGVLSATDADTGTEVTNFVIANDPSGAFEIVGNELKLKDDVSLDRETQESYEVVVEAIGSGGVASQQIFTIHVANVDEAPIDFGLTPAVTANALILNADGGVDDAAIAADLEAFPTDALTVEVRFSSDQSDVGDGTPLFSYAASNGSDNEVLVWLEGASGNLNIFLAGQKINTGVSNASLLDGQEHQVSFSWDQSSNELKVYIDGEAAFETTVNIRDLKSGGTLVFGQEQDREGGGFATSQVFEGEIAEVRIFDYARSGEEIADHAGTPIAQPDTEPGLVNNWQMNAESGGIIEDLAGANTLQLQNGAIIDASEFYNLPIVAENDAGAIVGTLSAIDPETGALVTEFEIADDSSGLFEIVNNQLKLKDGVSADYETQQSYDVSVRAISSSGEASELMLTVQVSDQVDLNIITGGDGNDRIRGTAGDDALYGMDGNDRLIGNAGADELYGGAGDDVIYADSADTVIDGGEGADRVIVQGDDDFSIDMAASNVERVDGAGGNDAIDASGATDRVRQYGNGGDDVLTGGAGNDIQRGGDGNDVIHGGDGNDNIQGNAGADELYGGAGDDVIYADGADTVIDGGEGTDRVIVQGDDDFSIDMAASNVERVDGAGGNDAIDASGATDRVRQYGNGGDDVLTGGAGNDIQRGGDGNDVIHGGDGNDNIQGNAGADELYGGAGDDVIYADGADTVIDGGEGTDRVIVQGDDDFSIDMAASNVERVDGAGGNDAIDASGATDRVRQYGNGGDDVLTGGAGNDIQRGGDGNDVIHGGDGNDNIQGNAGDDRLIGASGNDRIVGGDGDDTVVFSGNRADYTVQQINEATFRVTDNRVGSPDGRDTVQTVETFEFADQSISVDNILNAPPTNISLTPATSTRTVGAAVTNNEFSTSDGGGAGTATVDLASAVDGSQMITFVFASVDNSFELLVNGQSLTGQTLQLQSNVYKPDSQAFLQFEDGSAINSPWVSNSDGSPRIIVQVAETGVDVFAMRTPDSGQYEPMTIVNGEFFAPEFIAGENTVTVVNPDDDGPDGLSVTVSAQYDEVVEGPIEGENGAAVGALSAVDADAAGNHSFSVVDDPSGLFEVVGNELKVKDGMTLDAADQPSHDVTIEVMDEHGALYQETMTVEVQAAKPAASQFVIGDAENNNLVGGDGNDSLYGGSGDDTMTGGAGDDFLSGGDGSDVFIYEMGDGSDQIYGGAGQGWVDVIQLGDGVMPLGEFGVDWTVDLTVGTIESAEDGNIIFSDDASGHVSLNDGSTINFSDIEQLTY